MALRIPGLVRTFATGCSINQHLPKELQLLSKTDCNTKVFWAYAKTTKKHATVYVRDKGITPKECALVFEEGVVTCIETPYGKNIIEKVWRKAVTNHVVSLLKPPENENHPI